MTRVFIVDTDCGVDDAIALLMALSFPDMELAAITTVAGNTSVENVTRNVCLTLDVAGRDTPVYQGCSRPLLGELPGIGGLMGSDGLGDASTTLPITRRKIESEHAALALIRLSRQLSSPVTLVALGPLTNLALAVRLDPGFVQRISRLVIMGGAMYAQGNASPTAEFNFFADPEAAKIVLEAGFRDLWVLPWETSVAQVLPWQEYDALTALRTSKAEFFKTITARVRGVLESVFRLPGMPLPDPLAIAVALNGHVASESAFLPAMVETAIGLGRGLMALEWFPQHSPNIHLVKRVDFAVVLAMLWAALSDSQGRR